MRKLVWADNEEGKEGKEEKRNVEKSFFLVWLNTQTWLHIRLFPAKLISCGKLNRLQIQ